MANGTVESINDDGMSGKIKVISGGHPDSDGFQDFLDNLLILKNIEKPHDVYFIEKEYQDSNGNSVFVATNLVRKYS